MAPGTVWFGFRACAVVGLSIFVVNYVVVVLGRLDRRLGSMIALSQALLFRGTSLVVSLLIILLAIARLANIDYVSTLLDSVQTSDIVVSFAWAAYVVSWWYNYWVGRLTSEQLIQSLGPYVSPSSVAYPIDPTSAQHAPADGRLIELHGANRFAVFRPAARANQKDAFQTYGTFQIFHRLADTGGVACTPGIVQMSRNAWTYALSVTILPFVVLGGIGWWLHVGVQRAGSSPAPEHSTLPVKSILFGPDSCAAHTNARVIALAASGGGTRAAVFTGALLEGLRARKLLPNVRLISGVSGGGAASAYFASRRPQLIDAGNSPGMRTSTP